MMVEPPVPWVSPPLTVLGVLLAALAAQYVIDGLKGSFGI